MPTKMWARTSIIVLVSVFILATVISTAQSSSFHAEYPQPSIEPTIYQQGQDNWCGPGALQSSIDWIWRYNNGTSNMIPRATLWAFMRDNTCQDIGSGRDTVLPGHVGDGYTDVRKLNIAYDFGVDPHAMAWTMWAKTPVGYNYHYWVYNPNYVYDATRDMLWTVEEYHEPVIAAVLGGSHWVLVIGYDSDTAAYRTGPGTIRRIRIADPWTALKQWWPYSSTNMNDMPWTTYWFTPYTNSHDPDPSTGWYVPPPDHWRNHLVAIERDASWLNADWGWTPGNPLPPQYRTFLPVVFR